MAPNFGIGVSRTLDPAQASLTQVILQQGKPPLDSEFNLLQQIAADWQRTHTLRGSPSGWFGNPTNGSLSYVTSPAWSNWFKFGQQRSGEKGSIEWACVNGWLVPVTGTLTGTPPGSPNDADTWNRITLDPPPANSGDSRIDFVFLEAWQARLPPNPSASNKPGSSAIYRYGNVEGGYSYLPDTTLDPQIGFETSQRVQLQYRIRVVSGLVGLTSYPDGFDPTVVKARGAAAQATSFVFTNMGKELGDPGLWRAGDGTQNALGSVDGYVYAVPIAAVFRRNSVAWDGDPAQNLNGAFNRNPTAEDRTGFKTFTTTPTLSANLTASATSFGLVSVSNLPLPLTPASPVIIQVNDEVMVYSVITGTTVTVAQRGAYGTKPVTHKAGSTVKILSGRPDGLFSDQVTKTDILDLRHSVSPGGFDYDTLLQANLDRLLRGELRANWKRSGGGPQGPFLSYQDKISNSAASLGVTKLDGPDNIRQIWSDAAVQQKVEVIINTATGLGATWGLGLSASSTQASAGQYTVNDIIRIPFAQFKTGVIGADADQIKLVTGTIVRIDGDLIPLKLGVHYGLNTTATEQQIQFYSAFPTTSRNIYVTVNVLYGPGRGMSRRPDSMHSVAYLSGGTDIMLQLAGVPSDNTPLRTAWAPLWSKFRGAPFQNQLPVTAEAFADPGSKTVVISPFRRIPLPTNIRTMDGTNKNVNVGLAVAGTSLGVTNDTNTLTDGTVNFTALGVIAGDAVLIPGVESSASPAGEYRVTNVATTVLTLDRILPAASPVTYTVHHTQGLMPTSNSAGAAKWTTTDPLGMFSGSTDPAAATKNICLTLPRHLVPGWGEVRVPIIHSDTTTTPAGGSATFDEGINFLVLSKKGDRSGAGNNQEKNFVPFANGAVSWALFSTLNFVPATPAPYNGTFTFSGNTFAGMRFFSDSRGLGRQGLELPPFYGYSRLFAVYEASDYQVNGSAYDSTTRQPTGGGATNLLRQNFTGPTFWIEQDADGDATFVLNAEVVDISKSPNVISSFTAGQYVIEANIFGFDRGSFDLSKEFRMVLARGRNAGQGTSVTRTDNFGAGTGVASFSAPILVVPGPALASDEIAINYSRTPYQGDAWGSQTNQTDISYKPGPLSSGTAYQISSSVLDAQNLTRPNQKVLEVLSATAFSTSLGSGRLSGDAVLGNDPRNVAWEDVFATNGTAFPPATSVSTRPNILINALQGDDRTVTLGTEYHGCIERLPLGSLFRDKDFRGTLTAGANNSNYEHQVLSPLVFMSDRAPGVQATGTARSKTLDQDEIQINTATTASGQPGEIVVHVDGEQGNYGLTTNYRTNRGGSVFVGAGSRPGGEVASVLDVAGTHPSAPGVVNGIAMLVRNTPTSIGQTEVSAGGELMLLIVTTVARLNSSTKTVRQVLCGTNGTGEGYSAADLYHIEGRPLVNDNVRVTVDPSAIVLSRGIPVTGT